MSPVLPGNSSLKGRICRLSPLRVGSLLALEQFAGTELFPQHLHLPRRQLISELLAL